MSTAGIAGAYQQVDGAGLAHEMSGLMARNGPDGSRLYSLEEGRVAVHLAHRRDAVIDRGGDQPLVKRGLAVSYSGALYNCRDLRSELSTRGVSFMTDGDAEVVLEAWRRWGSGCLRRFRGMFALAVFDEHTGSLYLARDQFGIKPLLYLPRKDGVVFASELKALIGTCGNELTIDPGALVASMFYGWIPDRRCSVRGVAKLEPGTWVRFDPDGTYEAGRYWDIAEVAAAAAAGPPVDLRQVVEESVAAHLVSGPPIAGVLSGSLDSSIVTVLAQRQLREIDAYTVAYRRADGRLGPTSADAVYAQRTAERFGINLIELDLAPDALELLPRLMDVLDEPIGDPAAIGTWMMCEAASRAGARVMLSGLGADELFGGHRKHVACLLSAQYQRLPLAARDALSAIVPSLPVSVMGFGERYIGWAKQFLRFSELPEEAAFRRSYSLYDPVELLAVVGPEFGVHVDDLVGEHMEIYWDNQLPDPVSRMCLADTRNLLPGLKLAYAERASVASSIEMHLPFVDPVVFRAAFSLAGDEKVRGRRGQIALREAARAWLPDNPGDGWQVSPSAQVRKWICGDLRELIDDALVCGQLVASGFLRREAVEQLITDQRSGRDDRAKHIWQLLTLELWYRGMRVAGIGL